MKKQFLKMVDPLGKYWDQPKREDIQIEFGFAFMSPDAFDMLMEYSTSIPSGVYVGKMWKRMAMVRNVFINDGSKIKRWFLCWYDHEYKDERGELMMKIEQLPIAVL